MTNGFPITNDPPSVAAATSGAASPPSHDYGLGYLFNEVFDLKPTSEDKCCSVRCPQRIFPSAARTSSALRTAHATAKESGTFVHVSACTKRLAPRAQHSARVCHRTDSTWGTWGSAPGSHVTQNAPALKARSISAVISFRRPGYSRSIAGLKTRFQRFIYVMIGFLGRCLRLKLT